MGQEGDELDEEESLDSEIWSLKGVAYGEDDGSNKVIKPRRY
jgi:hypothetical protein